MRSSGSFLSGLLIGVLTSLGIVILYSLDFSPLSWFKEASPSPEKTDTIIDLTVRSNASATRTKNYSAEEKKADEFPVDSLNSSPADSNLSSIGQSISETTTSEEIVVMRDELIRTLFIDAQVIGKSSSSKSDSLIQTLQGGSSGKPGNYRVEIWRSPVNFKGYRLLRTSVITFGLDPDVPLKLFDLNSVMYLRSGTSVFKLQLTDKFLPFQPVIDDSILKQLR